MKLKIELPVKSTKEAVWKTIIDIEHCTETISAIDAIEILDRPESGLVGLKWKETRTMFGKTATEVMWITEAEDNKFYNTRAESHGSIYKTTMAVTPQAEGVLLSMAFNGEAQTTGAKIMSGLMGWMFKGAMKKAVVKDLQDIKAKVEQEA